MLEIQNGKVFINGEQTTNPELIGYAVLDAAESIGNDSNESTIHLQFDKEIQNHIELEKLKAIQHYLLLHGSNDEQINSNIQILQLSVKSMV